MLLRFSTGLVFSILTLPVAGQSSKPPRFESEIEPLFRSKCLTCHSRQARQAGLSLETREDLLKGGKSGPAIVVGKSADSLLLGMISSGKMPMGGPKLSDEQIAVVRRWIETGALKQDEGAGTAKPRIQVSEPEVAAILGANCLVCHGRRVKQAGLDLRTREAMLKGGQSGPAIVPGKPDESLLVKRIATQEMPPPELQEQFSVRGLTSDEFEKVKQWIAAGAPPDTDTPVDVVAGADPQVGEKDRNFWSFRLPVRPAVPQVRGQARVRNPIDAFLLQKLEAKGVTLSQEAEPLVLMRRAYFDLIGLPPTPEEIEQFLADRRPEAYERLVDRLLSSPQYGERWARYWLDGAGYADSEGGVSADNVRFHAWRYRDYVIRSLNADKPYDQFLTEQIAGDELFDYKATPVPGPEQLEKLVATGFLRMAPDATYSTEQNFMPERFDVIAGEIEILSSSVMGLTIGCARCHDHKYDPLPQRDYYRLSAILQTAYDPYDWLVPSMECVGVGAKCGDSNTRFLPLSLPEEQAQIEAHNQPITSAIKELEKLLEEKVAPFRKKVIEETLSRLPEEIKQDLRRALEMPAGNRTDVQKYLLQKFEPTMALKTEELEQRFEELAKELKPIRARIAEEKKKLKPIPRIRALFDMGGEPTPARILLRGGPYRPGALVLPGVPSVLSGGLAPYKIEKPGWSTDTSGRRLALARWLTQPNHPLTARVMVNRIWQHHFGTGLVRTPGNFGHTGSPPSHPELLDWLATEFVRQGWSIKNLHRLIMTSAAYRQSSKLDEARKAADPDNILLSRFPVRRLDADALRDSLLKIAGRLDLTPFGPPDELDILPTGEVTSKPRAGGYRRTIYVQQRRSKPVSLVESFDAPLLNPNCLKRAQSTVSTQALHLLNGDLVRESAMYMAGRIVDTAGDNIERQIERAYLLAYSRRPSPAEVQAAAVALAEMNSAWRKEMEAKLPPEPIAERSRWLALSAFCHTLLNSGEFLYID